MASRDDSKPVLVRIGKKYVHRRKYSAESIKRNKRFEGRRGFRCDGCGETRQTLYNYGLSPWLACNRECYFTVAALDKCDKADVRKATSEGKERERQRQLHERQARNRANSKLHGRSAKRRLKLVS